MAHRKSPRLPTRTLWLGGILLAGLLVLLNTGVTLHEPEKRPRLPHPLDVSPADREACDNSRLGNGSTGGAPWRQGGPRFSVYILDANSLLPEIPELTGDHFYCNISSPKVWPHNQPGRGMDSSNSTVHWEYQHANQWFITQSVRNSSLVQIVNNIDEADLVYVDLYCFNMWMYSFIHPFGEKNQPNPFSHMHFIVRHIENTPRFKRNQGYDYVWVQSHPAMHGYNEVFGKGRLCEGLRNVYWMIPERMSVCEAVQDSIPYNHATIIPYNAVNDLILKPITRQKKIFLFYRGACAILRMGQPNDPYLFTSGKLMRLAVVEGIKALPAALKGSGRRTRVACSCDICGDHLDHKQTIKRLASSLFCMVLPGDTQSSRRVSEVILSGCIPVFVGPPFHTMPMADVVDYKSFSVFFQFTNTKKWILRPKWKEPWEEPLRLLRIWQTDTDVSSTAKTVRTIEQAYRYLQSIPDEEINRMQRALETERYKFLYTPPPTQTTSVLGELLVEKMCLRSMAVKRWIALGAEEAANITASS